MLWGQRAILKVLKHACTKKLSDFSLPHNVILHIVVLWLFVKTEVLSETSKKFNLGISSCLYGSVDLFDVFFFFRGSMWGMYKRVFIKNIFLSSNPSHLKAIFFHKSFFEQRKASSISISIKNHFQHCLRFQIIFIKAYN